MPLVLALLGMAGLRTYEKQKGISKWKIKSSTNLLNGLTTMVITLVGKTLNKF
jgi:hypothetical protein